MTDKTATQNLTRTQSSDDPKKVAAYLKQLATDVDQRMAAHFYDLNRSVSPPFACVRLTKPTQIDVNATPSGAPYNAIFPWDTVVDDFGGLVDLGTYPYEITITEPGWWWIGGYALIPDWAVISDTGVRIRMSNGYVFGDPRRNGGVGSGISGSARVTSVASRVGVAMTLLGPSSPGVNTISFAEMWVCKVRDL